MSLVRFRFWALFFCYTELFSGGKGFLGKKDGLLAQAVEHLTFNQGVAGSSPAWLRMAFGINLKAFFVLLYKTAISNLRIIGCFFYCFSCIMGVDT